MHERSLAMTLIRQIEEELHARQWGPPVEVRLAIGEFAGVEPRLLGLAFEELAAERWGVTPQLSCDIVPLEARCRACLREFAVMRFRFECPGCGSRQVDVTGGEELQLVSLHVESSHQSMDSIG